MIIGLYARKSVYSDKSESVAIQLKIGEKYAREHYNVTSIIRYKDDGYTGANTSRPDFQRLMKDVEHKKIDMLICYKLDRISRNVSDFSKIFDELNHNGIEFVSVKEQIDTSTPLGRAMMYMCSVFAQMERETTEERVRDYMIELSISGKWAGGRAPLGYKREKTIINGKRHTILVKDEEKMPYLNMIFDTFLQGYALNGLETHFRKTGVKTINGCYLSSTQLYNILKNPHYVEATVDVYKYFENLGCTMAADISKFDGKHGVIAYRRTRGGRTKQHCMNKPEEWIISVGLHEPIIPAEKWLAVQAKFGKNKIDRTRKYKIGILKGILKCKCGYKMRVQHKIDRIYNKTYDNYFCQNRNRRGPEYCDMSMTRVKELDDKIIDMLKDITIDKGLLAKYIKTAPTIHTCDKETIKKELAGINKKIDNLTIAIEDAQESKAMKYIIKEIERLDKQSAGLSYELREAEQQEQAKMKQGDDINTIYTKIKNYIDNFDKLLYDDKVKFLQDIIKECIWDGETLSVTL